MDTLLSPYYDMLIGNAFLEFWNLFYALGRIEYGIKKGRIANSEVKVPEQRKSVIDEHARATFVEKKNKRKFNKEEGAVQNLSHSSQVMFFLSQLLVQERDPDVNSNYSPNSKRKRAKRYHALQYLMPNFFQYWSRNTRFPSYRLSLKNLHILNGMTSMLDVNTMVGFKDTLQKAAHHSKTKFKLQLMQIQVSSKNSSEVFKSDRVN